MQLNRRARLRRWLGLGAIGVAAFALALTRFEIAGEAYGLYLLREPGYPGVTLTDDLFLGQGDRMLAGLSFTGVRDIARAGDRLKRAGPFLETEWNAALGRGIVRNYLGDGTEIVTALSRFDNGAVDGGARHGVFVGGSLPDVAKDVAQQNRSGMSFRDASGRWQHVWCNANESVWDVDQWREIDTGKYVFLESHVLVNDSTRVVIESTHQISISGVPVHMERAAYFTAGKRYLELAVTLENIGVRPVRYMFLYGDEPWVGEFGRGDWNLGWTEEGVFGEESWIDARRMRGAGIVDIKTGTANFLAWPRENAPDIVYVSNELGSFSTGARLESNNISIGTEWRDRVLPPGRAHRFVLAIGMADRDPASGRLIVPLDVFGPGPDAEVTPRAAEGGAASAPTGAAPAGDRRRAAPGGQR